MRIKDKIRVLNMERRPIAAIIEDTSLSILLPVFPVYLKITHKAKLKKGLKRGLLFSKGDAPEVSSLSMFLGRRHLCKKILHRMHGLHLWHKDKGTHLVLAVYEKIGYTDKNFN